jgi:two-component system LytT family sensor kinase
VSVSDDGDGIAAGREMPEGRGIANTRERLRALYGQRASLAVTRAPEGGTLAVLRLPYRSIEREADHGER